MIESIAITNFYCFNETTTVSFVAGRERNKAADVFYNGITEQNRVNLLKMVYLYGNNGAGKSKLLMAFETLRELVTVMRDEKMERLPYHEFALNPFKEGHDPSEIVLVYHFDGKRYRYEIKWDDKAILEERLTLMKLASEAELFHRVYDEKKKLVEVDYGKAMEINDDTKYIIRTSLLKNNSVQPPKKFVTVKTSAQVYLNSV